MFCAIVFAVFLSNSISRSITQLTKFTKNVKTGNDNLRFVPESNDEIAFLGQQINDMLDEMQKASGQREQDLKRKQLLEAIRYVDLVIPDNTLSINEGAIKAINVEDDNTIKTQIDVVAKFYNIDL